MDNGEIRNCAECSEHIEIGKENEHTSVCPMQLIECPNNCRDDDFLRKYLLNHLQVCTREMRVECPYNIYNCTTIVTKNRLNLHLKEEVDYHLQLVCKYINNNKKESNNNNLHIFVLIFVVFVLFGLFYLYNLYSISEKVGISREIFENIALERLGVAKTAILWEIDTNIIINASIPTSVTSDAFILHQRNFTAQLQFDPANTDYYFKISVDLIECENDWNVVWPFMGAYTITLLNPSNLASSRSVLIRTRDYKKGCFETPNTKYKFDCNVGYSFSIETVTHIIEENSRYKVILVKIGIVDTSDE